MNRFNLCIPALFFGALLMIPKHLNAQVTQLGCTTDGTVKAYTCKSTGCVGSYAYPNTGENDVTTNTCCGKTVTIASGGNVPCSSGSLRKEETQIMLAQLSNEGAHLMIRSCKGHFIAYQPPFLDATRFFRRMTQIHLDNDGGM